MPSFRVLLVMLMMGAMAACATPQSLKPGTTVDEARSALGRPTGTYPLPSGGTRLQYSNQPFDQSVWNADFDAQGRLIRTEQAMTDAAFAQVRPGKDTREDVLRGFGVPAQTFDYRLVNESAWMYRYYTLRRIFRQRCSSTSIPRARCCGPKAASTPGRSEVLTANERK